MHLNLINPWLSIVLGNCPNNGSSYLCFEPFFFFQEKGIDTVNSSVIVSNTITLIINIIYIISKY